MFSTCKRSAGGGLLLTMVLWHPGFASAEYHPVITTPDWVETSISFDGYGFETRNTMRNLISAPPGSLPVIPIRPPIQFGNVLVETISDITDTVLEDTTIVSVASYYVSESALATAQIAASQPEFSVLTNFWDLGLGFCADRQRGFPLVRPEIEIGQIYSTCHSQESTTVTAADPTLGTPGFTQESTALIRTRLVYPGIDTVDNLFPGADITLVTGSFNALVHIQEMELEITTRTVFDDGTAPLDDVSFATTTAVSWMVDNIGVIKSVIMFGGWLDPLMSAPAFNSGDGVIAVGGFDAVVPSSEIVNTTLRASGGNVSEARDADISTGTVVIYDLSEMPWLTMSPTDDSDQDGVINSTDAFPFLGAASVDTDGDGRPDDWNSGCNLSCQEAAGLVVDNDDDNDGISDLLELTFGLNPLNAADAELDNDADGFSNREEAERGSDLLDPGSPASELDSNVVLFSSILPSSRSVQTGSVASAFATVVNAGSTDALGCRIVLSTPVPGEFFYQVTDPATNTPVGSRDAVVDLAAGQVQTFVVGITPEMTTPPTDVEFGFRCNNGADAPVFSGLNTLQFTAASYAVPDIVALTATVLSDGIVHVPGATGTGVFSVASVNVGAADTLTVTADTGDAVLSADAYLCQTDPLTGACINPPAPAASVSVDIAANATPTFGVFVAGRGNIPSDPAANRVFVRFADSGGVIRGSSSVAVQTD